MLSDLLLEALKGAVTGGLVGYATNELAVWMLFHPKSPKRLLGVPVPLTPGLVEKNRDRLAESIGQAVARDLLDSDTLATHLRELDLRTPVAAMLRAELAGLTADGRTLREAAGPGHGAALEEAVARIAAEAARHTPALARELVPRAAAQLAQPPAAMALAGIARDALAPRLAAVAPAVQEGLAAYLGSEDFAAAARERLATRLHQAIVAKFPMAKMLLGERTVHDMLESRWEEIAGELQEIARSPALAEALAQRLIAASDELADAVPGAIADGGTARRVAEAIAQWLASESGVESVAAGAQSALTRAVLDRPVRELVAILPADEWERAIAAAARMLDNRAHRLLPQLLREQLDLATVVTAKIREFDAQRIEDTIKRVSGRELRGIVRLGGLIGIVVGATMQVAFFLMRG